MIYHFVCLHKSSGIFRFARTVRESQKGLAFFRNHVKVLLIVFPHLAEVDEDALFDIVYACLCAPSFAIWMDSEDSSPSQPLYADGSPFRLKRFSVTNHLLPQFIRAPDPQQSPPGWFSSLTHLDLSLDENLLETPFSLKSLTSLTHLCCTCHAFVCELIPELISRCPDSLQVLVLVFLYFHREFVDMDWVRGVYDRRVVFGTRKYMGETQLNNTIYWKSTDDLIMWGVRWWSSDYVDVWEKAEELIRKREARQMLQN